MIPTGQVGHFKKISRAELKGRKNDLICEKKSDNLQRAYLHDYYIKGKNRILNFVKKSYFRSTSKNF